jgi:hypothetical protein
MSLTVPNTQQQIVNISTINTINIVSGNQTNNGKCSLMLVFAVRGSSFMFMFCASYSDI